MGAGRSGKRGEQTLARRSNLDRSDLIRARIVIDETPPDLLAYNVLRIPGGQPRDIGISVVVGEPCARWLKIAPAAVPANGYRSHATATR